MQTVLFQASSASLAAGVSSGKNIVSEGSKLRCKGLPVLTRRRRAGLPTRAVAEKDKVTEELSRVAAEATKKMREMAQQTNEVMDKLHFSEMKTELEAQATAAAKQLKEQAEIAAQQIKVQADLAQRELSNVITEVQQDPSKIVSLAKDAPLPIREIAETAVSAHSPEAIKRGAVIHDFCLGITYGAILVASGFFWFLVTGSVNALRFGIILGGGLLASGIGSLHAWQKGLSCLPYTLAQAAVTCILFARGASRYAQTQNFLPTGLNACFSLFMVGFYTYVLLSGGNRPKTTSAA